MRFNIDNLTYYDQARNTINYFHKPFFRARETFKIAKTQKTKFLADLLATLKASNHVLNISNMNFCLGRANELNKPCVSLYVRLSVYPMLLQCRNDKI